MTTVVESSVLRPVAAPAQVDRAQSAEPQPFRAGLVVVVIGYALLTVVLLVVGWLLTHPLNGSVGRWDEHVNEYLARHRTDGWNHVTGVVTASFNTLPVILAAAVVGGLLAMRRRWREAAFLAIALVVEISVFLSVTFVVARPRPDVVRLNSTPATSSFPSGHTAAATVLWVGIAIIVMCCTANVWARVASWLLAVLVVANVAFARTYRGLHHPTDVFAGALFGLACLTVAALAIRAASWQRAARDERRPVDFAAIDVRTTA
jgi:membrane-associated phospholipid phosphatase